MDKLRAAQDSGEAPLNLPVIADMEAVMASRHKEEMEKDSVSSLHSEEMEEDPVSSLHKLCQSRRWAESPFLSIVL